MALMLYNTYSKKEEQFTSLVPGKVSMYTCGPTVYGRPHIGNYSSFLMADLLRRWLEVGHQYNVTHVKNITDVGHLVADRDTGEDKVEKQAREEFGEVTMQSVIGIARKYEEQYLEDETALNMLPPAHRPRATDYIAQMSAMVEALLEAKQAYATEDGIYFDVTSFPKYGTLSGNTVENLSAGARVEVNEAKRHPADFALWKFCVGMNAHHVLRWPSPRGPDGETYPEGFPGWHIECSAMSRSLLGDQIDLHTGGEDNIFPHHECEIAQSESVTGRKPFVRLWLHKRRIDMGSEKMSKSLGNVLTLTDIREKNFSALDLRFYFLSVHYRTNLKFTWKGLEEAKLSRRKIAEWIGRKGQGELPDGHGSAKAPAEVQDIQAFKDQFAMAMDADLNVSEALAAIYGCMTYMNTHAFVGMKDVQTSVDEFSAMASQVFGCFAEEAQSIPAEVQALVDARADARAQKNFAESDRLRDEIKLLGYEVRDRGPEQEVKKL